MKYTIKGNRGPGTVVLNVDTLAKAKIAIVEYTKNGWKVELYIADTGNRYDIHRLFTKQICDV